MKGRDTVTVDEAARRLGIARSTAYRAVKRGQIPAHDYGTPDRPLYKVFRAQFEPHLAGEEVMANGPQSADFGGRS